MTSRVTPERIRVFGRASMTMSKTGRSCTMDWPKSSRARLRSMRRYRTIAGWSRPYLAMISSRTSGVVSGVKNLSATEPGDSSIRKKMMVTTPHRRGIARSSFRRMYLITAGLRAAG